MVLAHVKLLIFSDVSNMGGRVGKRLVKFCHQFQVANISTLLVQNSLHYVNIMTFESILRVIFVQDRYVSKN